MSVTVEFPNELLVATKTDREQFVRQAMIYTLGYLYGEGKISSGLGASILACDRWEFYRLLSEYGFAVIDYPADELAQEAETSRRLAAELRSQ